MKNLFDTDEEYNTDKDDDESSYIERFFNRRPSQELLDELDALDNKIDDFNERASLPLYATIIGCATFAILLLIISVSIDAFSDGLSFASQFQNAPYLFAIMILCAITSLSILIRLILLKLRAKKSYELNSAVSDRAMLELKLRKDANIPLSAPKLDVFIPLDDEPPKRSKAALSVYVDHMIFFVENASLSFADADTFYVYSIPLTQISEILRVERPISPIFWDGERLSISEYTKYGVTKRSDTVQFKYFYKLCINSGKDNFELFIPNYEVSVIQAMTSIIPKDA